MSNEMLHLDEHDRFDDSMINIDMIRYGGINHYAIASVVVRMDGDTDDSPDLVSFAERLVSRYNACAGMTDPAAEIAELKRQRDKLLNLVKQARLEWLDQNQTSDDTDVVTPYDHVLYRGIADES